MLLVLCAPLVSRWVASTHPVPTAQDVAPSHVHPLEDHAVAMPAEHAHHHGMAAHADGHATHAHANPHAEQSSAPAVDPHADHEMGVDCDYCLIAARLITLLVAAFLLLVPLAPVCRALAGAVRALPLRLMGTLGARGPPVLVA